LALHEELAPGAQLGRFTVLKKLGKGGMGVVHLAYDPELDRRVAIKLLHDTGDDDIASARLHREARAMAKLAHPNVVAVFEVGEYEGTIFVAMEYVQGETLREWLRAKKRTPREVLLVFVQAGRALAAAHSAGLLHRDFKPDNVIVDGDERARVLDFGLARQVSEMPTQPMLPSLESPGNESDETDRMVSGAPASAADTMSLVAGTPAYMGPEQLLDGRTDERSDQFAFCVTLYEALGNVRPFDGATFGESMAAKKDGRMTPPTRPIAANVRAIVVRGLHPDPSKRWPSMGALVDALEGAMRRRAKVTVVALVSAIAVVAATVSTIAIRRARPVMCEGLDRELAGVWDDAVRADVARGLHATGAKNADATIARVIPALDAYAKAWTAMSLDACEDARVRGTQSMDTLDLRSACLDGRAKEIRATVRVLASADGAVVDRAVKLVGALSPIEGCADLAALREPTAPPHDPSVRATVERIRDLVAQAKASFQSARYDACDAAAIDAARESEQIGARALEAEALYWRGMAAFYRQGGAKEAAARMLDATVAAEAARHDEFAINGWIWLVHFVGYALDRPDEGERYARFAEAAIQRRGGDAAATAHLLKVRGNVLYGEGKRTEALALYQQSVVMLEQLLGRTHPRAALARLDIGDDQYDRGDRKKALATYQEIADTLVRAYGESNPDAELILQRVAACEVSLALPTALAAATRANDATSYEDPDVEDNLGQALVLAGRAQEGVALLRKAIDRAPAFLDESQVLTMPLDLARALLREGQTAEAGTVIAKVHAAVRSAGKLDAKDALFTDEALWDVQVGQAKEAVIAATRARAIQHGADQDEVPDAAIADLALGEAKLALRAPAEAIAPLEHALKIGEEGIDPVFLSDTRLALSRALDATHADPDRAAKLASLATEGRR
jgi:tetratricopeptide (TPR) repeat protein/predicted Ser/Thr protein kinase